MLARVRSGALVGVDAVVVDVEVDMALGLPFFHVVGLPEGAVKESKVRVVSALKNSGFELPHKRITVNLAPADIRKEGAAFELPIAVGVLAAARILKGAKLGEYLFGGELSLDGAVKPIRGVLALALAARDGGYRGVIVPTANATEAALVDLIEVIPVATIMEAFGFLQGERAITPMARQTGEIHLNDGPLGALDMSDVRGQSEVKDALEVAAAGGHNMLMCGPPGSGKTMLARRLPTILPPMEFQEVIEVTKIYSVLGLISDGQSMIHDRPFRSPHHTISNAGLVGGGPMARPGELSMAHRGVLFLDELPEFQKHVLEVLRQPLEEGVVRLARANQNVSYPCQVMLVAAMNPCPCGYFNVHGRICMCNPNRVSEYHSRVSGPLLDRVDITLETRSVDVQHMTAEVGGEKTSNWYRDRVVEARLRQTARFKGMKGVLCNAQMSARQVRQWCVMVAAAQHALQGAVVQHSLSARAHDRILKMARTRADLQGHERIESDDMHFAIGCRVVDRRNWLKHQMGSQPQVPPFKDRVQQSVLSGAGEGNSGAK